MRDFPCRSNSTSPATAPENLLDACEVHVRQDTSSVRFDEYSSKSSLSMKSRFIEPVGNLDATKVSTVSENLIVEGDVEVLVLPDNGARKLAERS